MDGLINVLAAGQLNRPHAARQMAKQSVVDGIVFRAVRGKMANSKRAAQTLAQFTKLLPKSGTR